MALSHNCSTSDYNQAKSCSSNRYFYPNYYAINSNENVAVASSTNVSMTLDGISYTADTYNQSICLFYSEIYPYCTPSNFEFYVATEISSDNWNFGANNLAGIVGLGDGSPIWNIFNAD